MCKLHLSTLKYTEVHRFVDLSNRKCDIGRFPLDSALGPSGNISPLISPHTPWKSAPLHPDPHPSGISSNLPWGRYGYFLELHICKRNMNQFACIKWKTQWQWIAFKYLSNTWLFKSKHTIFILSKQNRKSKLWLKLSSQIITLNWAPNPPPFPGCNYS